MELKPTDEQLEVIDAARKGSESLMVKAYAGCAKSKTIEMALPGIKVPVLGLAFNKAIADGLKARVPANCRVQTMNGLGYAAWGRALAGKKIELDDRKLGKLVSQLAKEYKVSLTSDQWDFARQLTSAAMNAGLTPQGQGRPLAADTPEVWKALADELFIPEDDFPLISELAHAVLEENIRLAKLGFISFDDQIYCSVCLGGLFPRYPFVVVDESQDLNPLNHAMLGLCSHAEGRIMAVGDPKQSIYAFRGADSRSMEKIRALRPVWKDLLLSTTFRCPKVVVGRQQVHAPGFKAWHSNPEGSFARLPDLHGAFYDPSADGEIQPRWKWTEVADAASGEIAILCRANAPLLSMAFKLIRKRISVRMLGREIGKGLEALSRKIAAEDATSAIKFAGLLTEWLEHEVQMALANDQQEKVAGLQDRAGCLRAVLEDASVADAGALRAVLKSLFARDEGHVVLSTIHKAKGLEWDNVLHIDPWRIPSRWAKEAFNKGNPVPLEQDLNAGYVCETRTKNALRTASLEEFES